MLDWEEFLMRAFAFESSLTESNPLRFLEQMISPTQSLRLLRVVEENTLHSPSVSDLCSLYCLN